MDDFELRELTVDTFDVYDLVELLGLTVEDMVDKFDILGFEEYRTKVIKEIFEP